ncbi:MAG: tyrosine-protein phosphatase [Candidatus Methanomethylophilaceae archaeon]|nr:tyrosine-protein phosphatase [Candidatus Methanomethylophilaceae archaeon]
MDRNDARPLLALLITVIVMGGTLSVCFWPSQSEDEPYSVTGTVTGLSSYNQPKLDVKADTLTEQGIGLGALFTVTTENGTYHGAILLKSYLGMFMFDIFVNIEKDEYISIGCVGMLITADVGSEVTLTHTGESERYADTPHYNADSTDNRADYPSDEVFANFYAVTGGDIVPGRLYRSFSPIADSSRSAYADAQAQAAGIEFLIALSYTDQSVDAAIASLDRYCADVVCASGNYIAPSMGYLYFQQKEKTSDVLRSIIDNDGPYLIHCNVGRDRTGFVCLLLQALCGCTPDQMMNDEAKAFANLYHIETGSKEFNTVIRCTYDRNMYLIAHPDRIPDILQIDWNNIDVSSVDTEAAARSYCSDYLGLTDVEVDGLIARLCA